MGKFLASGIHRPQISDYMARRDAHATCHWANFGLLECCGYCHSLHSHQWCYSQEETLSHLGLTILSLAGRLSQSWKPHRSPAVTLGISLWIMPRPAVIHCTPPSSITPCRENKLAPFFY